MYTRNRQTLISIKYFCFLFPQQHENLCNTECENVKILVRVQLQNKRLSKSMMYFMSSSIHISAFKILIKGCYTVKIGTYCVHVASQDAILFIFLTRNTCMQQPLALVSKQPYFPNMKYLKIVVIFTLSIFLQKNVKIMKKL